MVSRFRSRLTYLAGVAIGGALCCLAVNSLPADAARPHVRNGLVAFDAFGGGVLAVRPDGSQRHRLTTHAADPAYPTFSPDGREIALATNNGLAIMNADGSHRHAIPNTDFGRPGAAPSEFPSFSPDGSKIVFDDRFGQIIFIVNADGSNLRQLTNHQGDAPVFTPDGKRIVFNDDTLSEVASVGVDGKGEHRVPGTVRSSDVCPCSFSPGGGRIVFAHGSGSMSEAIFMVNANGAHRHQVSHPPSDRIDVAPAFSPDGKLIVFNRTGFGEGDIVVMNTNGTHARTLAAANPGYGDPAWQPLR